MGLVGRTEAADKDYVPARVLIVDDHPLTREALSALLRGDGAATRGLSAEPEAVDAWVQRWRSRLAAAGDPRAVADGMDRVNPVYIPRNHRVEEALNAATEGDIAPLRRLVEVLAHPFSQRPGLERYAEPAPPNCGPYVTYCGT